MYVNFFKGYFMSVELMNLKTWGDLIDSILGDERSAFIN